MSTGRFAATLLAFGLAIVFLFPRDGAGRARNVVGGGACTYDDIVPMFCPEDGKGKCYSYVERCVATKGFVAKYNCNLEVGPGSKCNNDPECRFAKDDEIKIELPACTPKLIEE